MQLGRFTKLVLAAGLIALAAIPAAAQEPAWRSFSTADGLPANRAWAWAHDAEGTLWVGTENGLRKFFGGRFYAEDTLPDAVQDAWINALLATPDGSLWVGSSAGLFRHNPDGSWSQNLEQAANLNTTHISALLLDRTGAVWVGGRHGLARWSGGSWENITFRNTELQIQSLAIDVEDRIWVAEPTRVRILRDGMLVNTIEEQDGLPGGRLKQLLCDRKGYIWLATAGGLVQFDNLSVQRIFTQDDGLGSSAVWTIAESHKGGLWVGTDFGIAHVQNNLVNELITSADGLADDHIRSLFRDKEGNLWVGTDGGVTRLPLGQWSIESDPLLRRVSVSAVLLGEVQGDYVAIPGGIAQQSPDRYWTLLENGLPGKTTYSLVHDKSGQLWVGTDGGLARLEDGHFVVDSRIPPTHTVTALLADSQGTLWVGSHNGLHRLTDSTQALYGKASGELGQDSVLALWETKGGDVWVGTLNGGASRFRQGEWLQIGPQSTAGGLVGAVVLAGLEDDVGNLWFGTSQGLSSLQAGADPHDPSAWHTFTEPDIANNRVNVLWEDALRPGHIWAGTEGGLNLIVSDQVSTFTHQDGLSHKRITTLGQARDGTLWIGTALGLSYHQNQSQAPQIELRELLINQKLCDAECLAAGVPYDSDRALFQYQGSDLGNLEGIRYRPTFQASTDLVALPDSQTLTTTTNIPIDLVPGSTYTLAVAAVDKDFNESAPTPPLILRVNDATAWDRLRDHQLFPLMVLGTLFVVLFGGSAGGISAFRWYRTRSQYHYHDVHITVTGTEQPERVHASLETYQIKSASKNRLVNRLIRSLPQRKQAPRPKVQVEKIPIDLRGIKEIQESIKLLNKEQVNLVRLQFVGQTLYDMLLTPEPIAQQLAQLGLGINSLRLRLSFDGHAELAGLPWELLYGGKAIGFLGQRADTALARFVEPAEDLQRSVIDRRLRVLVVMAQPDDKRVRPLNLAAEKSYLDKVLADIAQVKYLFGKHAAEVLGIQAKAKYLPEQLLKRLEQDWDVIHFVGHAGLDLEPFGEPEVVLWCEDFRGGYMALSAETLATGLRAGQVPKLVVLNACETASLESKLVRTMLDEGVGAVVGMQWPIMDRAAATFTEGFYRTLKNQGQVDHAMNIARNQIARKIGSGRPDWAAPVLVMQTVDGLIFERP